MCTYRSEDNPGCLFLGTFHILFETGSLAGLELCSVHRQASSLQVSRDSPAPPPSQGARITGMHFYLCSRDLNSVPLESARQVVYQLSHLSGPPGIFYVSPKHPFTHCDTTHFALGEGDKKFCGPILFWNRLASRMHGSLLPLGGAIPSYFLSCPFLSSKPVQCG